MTARSAGWSVAWRDTKSGFQRYEVFTAPDGTEYRRTPTRELADLVLKMKTPGLNPLYLKKISKPFTKEVACTEPR